MTGGALIVAVTALFATLSLEQSTSGAAERAVFAAVSEVQRATLSMPASDTQEPITLALADDDAQPSDNPADEAITTASNADAPPKAEAPALSDASRPVLAAEAPKAPSPEREPALHAPSIPAPNRVPARQATASRAVAHGGHHRGQNRVAAAPSDRDARREQAIVPAQPPPTRSLASFFSQQSDDGTGVVVEARRWLGTNPTSRASLWCARFMNFVLERTGHKGSGSDLARSFSSYGQRVAGPQVGAIAVMARAGGGHVGVVSGIDGKGNPIIISGNYSHRVAEATYPRGRIYAYVMP